MLKLEIVNVRQDPNRNYRLRTGNFRINKELNQEWIDIQNIGTEPIDLGGRVLACINPKGNKSDLIDYSPQKEAIRSSQAVPIYPKEILRVFTGEQPYESTYIPDEHNISRVIWLLRHTYMWVDSASEAHIYLNMNCFRNFEQPLAKYNYNPWF